MDSINDFCLTMYHWFPTFFWRIKYQSFILLAPAYQLPPNEKFKDNVYCLYWPSVLTKKRLRMAMFSWFAYMVIQLSPSSKINDYGTRPILFPLVSICPEKKRELTWVMRRPLPDFQYISITLICSANLFLRFSRETTPITFLEMIFFAEIELFWIWS